jgi:hypothetical protein
VPQRGVVPHAVAAAHIAQERVTGVRDKLIPSGLSIDLLCPGEIGQ